MAVAAREVPHIAGSEIDDLGLVLCVYRGEARMALDHIGPLCRVGMPVQLAHRARLQRHVDAGERFGDGKLAGIGFLRGAAVELFGGNIAQRIAERRQLRTGERLGRGADGRLRGFRHRETFMGWLW
jgi:hypothetical protein